MTYKISTDRRFHLWEGTETRMNVDTFLFFIRSHFFQPGFSLTLKISVLNSKSPSYQHFIVSWTKDLHHNILSFHTLYLFSFKFTKPHNLSGPQPRYLFFPFQFLPFHEIDPNELQAYNDYTIICINLRYN